LRKKFGEAWAVDQVSFDIDEGKLLVLLGPSGCGKTTTLRCIGGLEHPDEGQIVIDGLEVTNAGTGRYLQPEARGMGMVAQSYAIWPHMSVRENVAFPLRMRKENSDVIQERVRDALKFVRLGGLEDRNATDLSGGQQQRVALARAIVARPKVILFDEPLSNLDAKLREQMRYLIRGIQKEIGITAVYVTHDQAEAMGLGDELIVMNSGRIEQRGSARSLYCEPTTRFVAEFIGIANILQGRIAEPLSDGATIGVRLGEDGTGPIIHCLLGGYGGNGDVTVLARPEWIGVVPDASAAAGDSVPGTVVNSQYLGERTELIVRTALGDLRVTADSANEYAEGMDVRLAFDANRCIALPGRAMGQAE